MTPPTGLPPLPRPPLPLEELVRDATAIRALAVKLTGDVHSAEDVVQELAVRALRHDGAEIRRPGAWLRSVLRNLVRDRGRTTGRRRAREESAAPRPGVEAPDDIVARAELSRRVMGAVLALDEPYRSTVLLRYFDGMTSVEIARREGLTPEAVRSRLHRAVARLRAGLATDAPEGLPALLLPLVGVPMLRRGLETAAAPGAAVTQGTSIPGGLAMAASTKKTALGILGVLLCALLVGRAIVVLSGPDDASASAVEAPTTERVERDRRRVVAESAAPAETPTPPPVAAEAEADPSPELVRLLTARVVEVRDREPPFRRPVPVVRAPDAGADDEVADDVEVGGGGGLTVSGTDTELSRWDLIPPFGDVTLSGRVIDADGAPVPGASLLRLPYGADGSPRRVGRYMFFQPVGHADADGRFTLEGQSPGRYGLTADHATTMRTEGDLDTSPALAIAALPGAQIRDLVITLPIRVASFGAATVKVVDESGEALGGDTVELVGHGSAFTERDGAWTFHGVVPGTYTARSRPYGYTLDQADLAVRAGETADVTLTVRREQVGTAEVAGRVVDRGRAGVEGAVVYLGNNSGLSYRVVTDGAGRFRFRKLPEVLARDPFIVTTHPSPARQDHTSTSADDLLLPVDDLVLVVDRRHPVVVHVVDPDTGGQVAPHAVSASRTLVEDAEERVEHIPGATLRRPGAPLTLMLPLGTVRLTVSAPGRRTRVYEVDVPAAEGPLRVEIPLDAR